MRVRRAAGNVALAVVSTTLCLLVLEGGARWLYAREPPAKDDTRAMYTQFDPLLGWAKKPGARATYRRKEYTVEVSINSLGLRDPERGYDAPGVFRILGLGDSTLEGYTVPLADTVTQRLEAALRRPGCPMEVINGGTGGYSTDQEYLFYKTEGVRYSPQVVALFFASNDVWYNGYGDYYGRAKPLLVFDGGPIRPRHSALPRPEVRPLSPSPPRRSPPKGSALLALVRTRILNGAPGAYHRLAAMGLWEAIEPERPDGSFKVYKSAPNETDEPWRITERIIAALAEDVAATGSRFMIVYVPDRMEVDDRAFELSRMRYGMNPNRWSQRNVVEHLRGIADRVGVPLVDPTAALRARQRGTWAGPYFVQDGHWNSLGHEIGAGEVERFLRAQSWLPPCAATDRQSASAVD